MLSFIYRLVRDFEKEHGIQPNLLYLNQMHLNFLREQLSPAEQPNAIFRQLGLEIIITQEATHPHVAWMKPAWQRKAV